MFSIVCRYNLRTAFSGRLRWRGQERPQADPEVPAPPPRPAHQPQHPHLLPGAAQHQVVISSWYLTLKISHCIRTTQGGGGSERAHHLGGAGAGVHGPHLASPVQQDLHRLRGRREGRAHGQRQLAVQEQVESAEDDRQAGGQGLRQVELRPGIWPGCQKILEQRK